MDTGYERGKFLKAFAFQLAAPPHTQAIIRPDCLFVNIKCHNLFGAEDYFTGKSVIDSNGQCLGIYRGPLVGG